MESKQELLALLKEDPQLSAVLSALQEHSDAAHDQAHLLRVALWTLKLSENKLPFKLAVTAALLHDLVNVPKNSPDRSKASEYSAKAADELLARLEYTKEEREEVYQAILTHSYSRGLAPTKLLGQCLQDADRLEGLGAIGLMRVFSTGALMKTKYFHPEDPWAKRRELDDLKYSVDHFFAKLLKLPASMNTELGRIEAERRAEVLKRFLQDLSAEIGEPCDF